MLAEDLPSDTAVGSLDGAELAVVIGAAAVERFQAELNAFRAAGRPTILLGDAGSQLASRCADGFDVALSTACSSADLVEAARGLLDGRRGRPFRSPSARHRRLTSQESRVLAYVAAGSSDGDIADALGLSINTVRTHVQRARLKIGARDRLHLMALARDLALDGERV